MILYKVKDYEWTSFTQNEWIRKYLKGCCHTKCAYKHFLLIKSPIGVVPVDFQFDRHSFSCLMSFLALLSNHVFWTGYILITILSVSFDTLSLLGKCIVMCVYIYIHNRSNPSFKGTLHTLRRMLLGVTQQETS